MDERSRDDSRRAFLRRVVATGAAGTAAVAVGVGVRDEAEVQSQASATAESVGPRGYRETDHVRRYYRLVRL